MYMKDFSVAGVLPLTDNSLKDLAPFSCTEADTWGEVDEDAMDTSSDESEPDGEVDELSDDESSCPPISTFAPEETVIVFDWDDTILPSTWLLRQGLKLDTASVPNMEQRLELAQVAKSAARVLQCAKRFGTVVLVTNAELGWIELTCTKFLPGLRPFLEGIHIVSARSQYEKQGVKSPIEWKVRAFEVEFRNFYSAFGDDHRKHVISIGDSMHERQALLRVAKQMTDCCSKSLKFVEKPDLRQLKKEHALIRQCIPHIVGHDGDLDLSIQLA